MFYSNYPSFTVILILRPGQTHILRLFHNINQKNILNQIDMNYFAKYCTNFNSVLSYKMCLKSIKLRNKMSK